MQKRPINFEIRHTLMINMNIIGLKILLIISSILTMEYSHDSLKNNVLIQETNTLWKLIVFRFI